MASYTPTQSKHATLTAASVDTVTFASSAPTYEVVNFGTADIYVRSDGTNPTVGGDDTDVVRAGEWIAHRPQHFTAEVRLISSGAAEYHIARRE